MKSRIASLTLVAAMALALSAAALISQQASAQCGLPGTPPCTGGGGDKQKRPTPTDTRVPRSTSTPVATSPVCVASTPDAAQLQTLCAGLLPAGGAGGTNPQAPNPGGSNTIGGSGGTPQPGGFPWPAFGEGALGGLLFGLIIVVCFPGLRNALTLTGGRGAFGVNSFGGAGASPTAVEGNDALNNPWGTNMAKIFDKASPRDPDKRVLPGGTLDGSVQQTFDEAQKFGKVMPSGSNTPTGQSGPGTSESDGGSTGQSGPGTGGGGGLGESSSN